MALIVVVPSFVMLLLGYFFAASSGDVSVGIVLADHRTGTSHLSELIAEGLNASDNVTVVYLREDEINASLVNKTVDGVVYFPPNFTRNVLSAHPASVKIITDGSSPAAAASIAQKYASVSSRVLAPYLTPADGSQPIAVTNASAALMPSVEIVELYGEGYKTIDFYAPYILAVIAFIFIFMFTGVTFLRERSFGTLERLMASPLTRGEIIMGYMLGFSLFALAQSLIILAFAVFVLNVKIAGSVYAVVAVQILVTLAAVNLGIFVSSFAKNELQAIQFIPLLLLPQVFLDGMFWPISTLPGYLQALAYAMPLTYANDALQGIMVRGLGPGDLWVDIAVLIAFAVAMVVLASLTLSERLQ